jgi:hypothetical protein
VNIEAEVMRRYPKNPEELKCRPLRERMNGLREMYRKRLMKESEKMDLKQLCDYYGIPCELLPNGQTSTHSKTSTPDRPV